MINILSTLLTIFIFHYRKIKKTTKAKHERLTTGGGLPDKKEEDPVLSMVDDAAPYADVEISKTWDSTYAFQQYAVIPQGQYIIISFSNVK